LEIINSAVREHQFWTAREAADAAMISKDKHHLAAVVGDAGESSEFEC
jgi:hypothetical protein